MSDEYLFQNYVRAPVAFTHGHGTQLWDARGHEYLDFIAGIATSSLGHAHPRLVEAIAGQAERYLHVSNLYRIPEQEEAARLLVEASRRRGPGLDRVFFCNSGTEANEAAIKIARKRGNASGRYEIVVTHGGFHGRTLGSLAATGTPRYHEGFGPLPEGFVFTDFNDLEGLRGAIGEKTCAVLVEPMQGEGGVFPATAEYLRGVAETCREHDLLFLLDEVQTGIGRTGSMFAFQQYEVAPDVVTLGKGLGGGVPIGAVLATEAAAAILVPGDHGTTFGGNPLVTAAAAAVIRTVDDEGLLDNVRQAGARLAAGLESIEGVVSVRGKGLLLAAELAVEAAPVVARCLEEGLLVNAVRPSSVRFAPPLNVKTTEVDRALAIFSRTLSTFVQPAGGS
ncbi:MAG: acetylornithine transaminase [Thermoanaerobaculia bacterium]|nr:acetylornithine transaminase [Thermoanaerobaculia bacterium]